MKTTIGANAILWLLAVASLASAGDKRTSQGGYALVAGTVFREPGFALPKAEVTLTLRALAEGGKKIKPQKVLTDARGEFAIRVPPGPAEYSLAIKADGFVPVEKSLKVEALETVDHFVTLKPRTKME